MTQTPEKTFSLDQLEALDESFVERTTEVTFSLPTNAGPFLLHAIAPSTYERMAFTGAYGDGAYGIMQLLRAKVTHCTPPPDTRGVQERMRVPTQNEYVNGAQVPMMTERFASALGINRILEVGTKLQLMARLTDVQRDAIRFTGRSGEERTGASVKTPDVGADANSAATEVLTLGGESST